MKRRAVLLVAFASACTCDPAAQNGTAVRIRVGIESGLVVNQVSFALTADGGDLFSPVTRPETPGPTLDSGGSLLVLVADALAGQTVGCHVEAFAAGEPVTAADGTAVVSRGFEVPCNVTLAAAQGCSAANCAGCCEGDTCVKVIGVAACGTGGESCRVCQAGQRCGAGACLCDSASCSGCCSGNVCITPGTPQMCGQSGRACMACAAGQACTNGDCTCDGGPCGSGSCTSCPTGCCGGGSCQASTVAGCGVMGTACSDCRTSLSDTCNAAGVCVCGTAAGPCAPNKHCVGGRCICDSTVCDGCCTTSGTCDVGTDKTSCGSDGGACAKCNMGKQCTAHACQ